MKTLFTAAAAAALTAGAAFAQDADAEITFEALDTDMNGVLSLEEVQTAAPEVTAESFAEYDEDGDEALNEDEFDAWVEASTEAEGEDDGEGEDGGEPAEEPYQR
ncbi:MAG: hypothetical protein ACFE0P_14290 [Oceanicaulis sp.]